jgi:hypothetical protein
MTSPSLYVAIDRSRLRVYRPSLHEGTGANGAWEVVTSVDFPDGRADYAEATTDAAGRFPTAQGPGMSIDERLPLKEEHERRVVANLAAGLERCLAAHPDAVWHFAAGPGLFQAVERQLSPQVNARRGRTLERNLAKLPPEELRSHFAPA